MTRSPFGKLQAKTPSRESMERGVSDLRQTERDEAEATEEGEPPESERGSGVPLRSELAERNEALVGHNEALVRDNEELRARLAQTEALERENEELRAWLADSEKQRRQSEEELAEIREQFAECERKLEEALKKDEPAPAPSAETRPEPEPEPEPEPKGPEGYKPGTLRDAVMAGELSAVSELMDKGVDPNSPRERLADWTPLHYAAQLGHTEIIDTLLDHGAEPQSRDKDGQTPLMQTGYWGRTEAKELLLRRGGGEESGVPPKMIMEAEFASKIGRWNAEGSVTIICSAPEFSLPYVDGTKDNVMKALFALCDMHRTHVKFGYDWGGSSTAEPADKDPNRLVPECCLSLACSCGHDRSTIMVKGPVQWWNPKSVAGSMWFPKYITKVQSNIMYAAQLGMKIIVMVALRGGPVTQLEHRTMPFIIAGAIKDLRVKGMSISLLGDAEKTEIKLCLRIMEYDEFLSQFYDESVITLSKSGMCIAAAAKKTQKELLTMAPADLVQLQFKDEHPAVRTKLADEDLAAIRKQYEALSEEDKAKADEARGRPTEETEHALIMAANAGQTAEVRVLLAAGTDPDVASKDGSTALICAAYGGHEEAVGALAEGGADLDKVDKDGVTPLMEAARYGQSGAVRRLLDLGADHTVVGTAGWFEGKTALEVAEAKDKEEAAAVLRAWALEVAEQSVSLGQSPTRHA